MSVVNITDISVVNNPAKFTDPFVFRITFECIAPLEDELDWRIVYVGSAQSDSFDQELDTCSVGPVPVGVNSFDFEADAPSPTRIPDSDIIGVTVIFLTCSYKGQEFVRVGYYVNAEYDDSALREQHEKAQESEGQLQPPKPLEHLERIVRHVLNDKPRVTRFNITWDHASEAASELIQTQDVPAALPQPFLA